MNADYTRMPLEGIRIADFTWAMAGPYGTHFLADFGAEVIKIERREIGDRTRIAFGPKVAFEGKTGLNRSGFFNMWNRGKLSVTLDLSNPRGAEIAKRIVAISDVVIENFSASVMKKFGLDYEELRKIKPDIIMVSMSGFGHSGPNREYVSYGPSIHAYSGLTSITGFPGEKPPGLGFSYADHAGGFTGALAVLLALFYKKKTGKGQFVDAAQVEACSALIGDGFLDAIINQRPVTPSGNLQQNRSAAPHGIYSCSGEDRWCAISVFTQEEWCCLCEIMGNPTWVEDTRFSSIHNRIKNVDELDHLIEEWTSQHSPEEVMDLLQKRGIAAGIVQNAEDLFERDPQLKARNFYLYADHTELGSLAYEGLPIKLSDTPGRIQKGAPLLGEHNDYVYQQLLNIPEAEINQLYIEGVV